MTPPWHRVRTQDGIAWLRTATYDDARPVVLSARRQPDRHAGALQRRPRMRIHSRRLRHPRSRRQRLGPSRQVRHRATRDRSSRRAEHQRYTALRSWCIPWGHDRACTHLLTSGASWAAVVLVDVTPRLEFQAPVAW